MNTQDAKDEFKKQVEKVEGLADEIRVKLHLAALDVKQEWDDKLSPRVYQLKDAATHTVEDSKEKVAELVGELEKFANRLRGDSHHKS